MLFHSDCSLGLGLVTHNALNASHSAAHLCSFATPTHLHLLASPRTYTCLLRRCGPPPMIKFAIQPAFDALGYTEDMTFFF